MPTIANQPITTGTIRMWEQGDWFADVATNSSERIPNGTRVDIVAETLTLSGAIVRGDITESVGRYQVAGRPEWAATLPARPSNAYNSANAVLLKTVLSDILRDTFGTNWAALVVMPPAANLAKHYERPGANSDTTITARDLLALLKLSWYVRDDGITVFGTRPTGNVVTPERVLVEYRNDAIGYRVVNCEDPGAFMPGLTFEGEVIGETTFAISSDDITIHLWSRGASNAESNWFARMWRRLFPRAELQGVYEYVVAGPTSQGRHDLRSIGSRWLPDVKLASFWAGIGGYRASLPVGTRVGISFMDSNPAKPILVNVEPVTFSEVGFQRAPDTSGHYANDTIMVEAGTSVTVTAGSVASMNADNVNLGAAEAPVIRSGDTVTMTVPGMPPIVATGLIQLNVLDPATIAPTKVKA
jgi:hypothetical protein